ncbi:MAG: 4-(cytidine 5'-diphospho)-2-C-methyl-D-erythritol kinase [Caldimicrobium sp.]
MSKVFSLSPAKINLTLQVLKKRKDGYHEIYSIFQKIALFDEIEIEISPSFSLDFISEEEIPLEKNLLYRAWKLFQESFGIKSEIKIRVTKRIPIGAGLGGGSSNAGTLLKILSKLFEIEREKVIFLAQRLGADVTFFVTDYFSAEARGIGEILRPYPSHPAYYLLLYPNFPINTAWAYKALGLTKEKEAIIYKTFPAPWNQPQGLINDFKELIYKHYPEYAVYEKILLEEGALAVNLTGTGSTIYGVFKEPPLKFLPGLKKFLKGVKIYLAKNLDNGGGI